MRGLSATVLIAGAACGLLTASQTAILASLYDYPLGLLSVGVALGGGLAGWLGGRKGPDSIPADKVILWLAFSGPLAAAGTAMGFTGWAWTIPGFLLMLVAWVVPFAAVGAVCAAGAGRAGSRWELLGVAALGLGYLGGMAAAGWVQNALGGPINAGWAAAVMIGVAVLAAGVTGKRLWASGLALAAVWLVATGTGWGRAPLPPVPASELSAAALRPLYRHRVLPGGLVLHRVRWHDGVRDDELRAVGAPFASFYSNGTPPILSARGDQERIGAELNAGRLPLLALPVIVARPKRVLVVGAAAGASVQVMRRLGVKRVRVLAYDPVLQSMIDAGRSGPRNSGALDAAGLPVRVRAELAQDRSHYGVILLPLGQSCATGRCASNAPDALLLTREALTSYWNHLVPGGALAVATDDRGLFLRAMLMAWRLPDRRQDPAYGGLVRHAWGVDAVRGESFASPYRHLLLVVKGGAAAPDLVARMHDAAVDLPIVVRFGPGFQATGPYRLLERATRARVAEAVIGSFSRIYSEWADFRTATDRHPFFFVTVRSGAPRLKWLFGAALLGLVLIALWAVPGLHAARSPEAADRPPIPVTLGVFAGLGGGLALVVTSLGERLTLVAGSPVFGAEVVLGACVVGLVIGHAVADRPDCRRTPLGVAVAWFAPVLAAVVAFGTDRLAVASRLESVPAFGLYAGAAAIALAAALAGVASAITLALAHRRLRETMCTFNGAAAGMCVLGAAAGSALAPWLAQVYDFERVWLVAAALGAAVFAAGAWTWGFVAPCAANSPMGRRATVGHDTADSDAPTSKAADV